MDQKQIDELKALTDAVAGPAIVKFADSEGDGVRSQILIHGDLLWRPSPASSDSTGELQKLTSWTNKSDVFDLIRASSTNSESSKTTLSNPTTRELHLYNTSNSTTGKKRSKSIILSFDSDQECTFWENHLRLSIDSWEDIASMKPQDYSSRTPSTVYAVSRCLPMSTLSEETKTVGKIVSHSVKQAIKVAHDFAKDVDESGIFVALTAAPVVGAAFAMIGYGIHTLERCEANAQDSKKALKKARDLTQQCMDQLVSMEGLRHLDHAPPVENRRKKVLQILDTLENVYGIILKSQRNKARGSFFQLLLKKEGEGTRLLTMLESCQASLQDQNIHAATIGIDSTHRFIREVYEAIVDMSQDFQERFDQIEASLESKANEGIKSLSIGTATSGVIALEDSTETKLAQVRACTSIADFTKVYDSDFFQATLQRLHSARDGNVNEEEWAKAWAQDLIQKESHAEQLNWDRKVCLELLYVMCDCWKPKKKDAKPTVTDDDIVDSFKTKRVERIMVLCVPMDRAQALYVMQIHGHPRGMHWYTKKHAECDPSWKKIAEDYEGKPTLNKRLVWLVDLEKLELRNKSLKKCMMPVAKKHLLPENIVEDENTSVVISE